MKQVVKALSSSGFYSFVDDLHILFWCSCVGMTTQVPQSRQSPSTVRSLFAGFSSAGVSVGQPCLGELKHLAENGVSSGGLGDLQSSHQR